jgi:hypothetical protein
MNSKRKTAELPFTDEEIEEIFAGLHPDIREIIEIRIGPDGRKQYRIKPEYFEEEVMNLDKWLDGLAESLHHKPTKLESFEYLQELRTWLLTDDEWIELKSLAKRRQQFFPRISELEELMHEVKRQTVSGKPNDRCWETFQGEDGRCYARRPQAKTD